MDVRPLTYFLAIAHEGSFTRAAKRLHLAQPSLSQQIRSLERELGVTLFTRGRTGATLTEAGEALRVRALEIVSLVDRASWEVSHIEAAELTGIVRIGSGETAAQAALAHVAAWFRAEHPRVRFSFVTKDAPELLAMLSRSAVDFAVLGGSFDVSAHEAVRLPVGGVWGVLADEDASLSARNAIEAADLSHEELIVPEQALSQRRISTILGCDVTDLDISAFYNIAQSATAMVRAGLGHALVFGDMAQTSPEPGLVFRPLAHQQPEQLSLVWRRGAPLAPACRAFATAVASPLPHRADA